MKKLTIGRNVACDIIINDTTDLVSRKQAVLTITFFGKMVIYDTSNNGTYVNGERLQNGKGRVVTRKDKVNFAHIADFDWNAVKDPYKGLKIAIVAMALLLALCVGGAAWWMTRPEPEPEPVDTTAVEKKDSVTDVNPVINEDIQAEPEKPVKNSKKSRKSKKTKKNQDKKPDSTMDIINKKVDNKTPIIY